MIESGNIASFILWGPPGVGKTTLARIIAHHLERPFYTLSAVTSGVKEVREVIEKAKNNISEFLNVFLKQMSGEELEFKVLNDEYYIIVEILGENTNSLIGYRGETLNALQTLLSSIANKDIEEKIRVILDISGYKDKRKKVLEELADKISKTVVKTGKKVTLEPMPAYERKIIHARLQNNKKVTTESVGEEPHRKIVVELKKN